MPLEIRESIIRINILDKKTEENGSQSMMDPQMLVKECVEQVLEVLKEREER